MSNSYSLENTMQEKKNVMQIVIRRHMRALSMYRLDWEVVVFFLHSLVFLSLLSRMKSLWVILQAGPAIYQRWAKRTHKWKHPNEWMSGLPPPRRQENKRIKTEGCLWGELESKAGIDKTDRRAVEGEQLIDNQFLSHHIVTIRAAFLISLNSAALCQTLQTSVVCDSCLSLFSPFSSLLFSVLPQATLQQMWLQGFNLWSPEPLRRKTLYLC